jgi:hypothetical protein
MEVEGWRSIREPKYAVSKSLCGILKLSAVVGVGVGRYIETNELKGLGDEISSVRCWRGFHKDQKDSILMKQENIACQGRRTPSQFNTYS